LELRAQSRSRPSITYYIEHAGTAKYSGTAFELRHAITQQQQNTNAVTAANAEAKRHHR